MVAREPGHRARRLTERDRAVVRPQPALAPPVVMGDRLRRARVAHDAAEGRALPEVLARLQGQLLPVPANPRPAAVDGGTQHLHAEEVEIEGAEVRRGLRGDLRGALEAAAAGVVGQGQGVVGDVVAAVAELREVRVTGARGTGAPAAEHRARCPRPGGVRARTSPRPTAVTAVGLRARGERGEQARDREGGQTSGCLHTADHDPAPGRPDLATPYPWPLRRAPRRAARSPGTGSRPTRGSVCSVGRSLNVRVVMAQATVAALARTGGAVARHAAATASAQSGCRASSSRWRAASRTKRPPIRRPVGYEEQATHTQVSKAGPFPGGGPVHAPATTQGPACDGRPAPRRPPRAASSPSLHSRSPAGEPADPLHRPPW